MYRVRCKKPDGAALIIKVEAESEADALTKATAILKDAGRDLTTLHSFAVKNMPSKTTSAIYEGKVPEPKTAKVPTPAATPAAGTPKGKGKGGKGGK